MFKYLKYLLGTSWKFVYHNSGNVALIFGIMLVPISLSTGAVVDYSRGFSVKSRLQEAVDAAALAATIAHDQTPSDRIAVAQHVFAANYSGPSTTPQVTFGNNSATVSATTTTPTILMGIVGITEMQTSASATAGFSEVPGPCLFVLDPNMTKSVHAKDESEIEVDDCAIAVDSGDNQAVYMDGESEMETEKLYISGNYVLSGGDIDADSGIKVGAAYVPDPYIDTPVAAFGGCSGGVNRVITEDTTLSPGVFCGGLTVRNGADVDLNPGIYVIDSGDLVVDEISEIEGDNVVFVITTNGAPETIGSLRIIDHSQIRITAPNTGPYAGIAVYQDRAAAPGGENIIQGLSSGSGPAPELRVEGSVYLPSRQLRMDGDALLRVEETDPCGLIVINNLILEGDARLHTDCEADEVPTMKDGVRLLL